MSAELPFRPDAQRWVKLVLSESKESFTPADIEAAQLAFMARPEWSETKRMLARDLLRNAGGAAAVADALNRGEVKP